MLELQAGASRKAIREKPSINHCLGPGYSVDIDRVNKDIWTKTIQSFDDATLMQTWSYGAVRWGEGNLGHILLKKDGQTAAAAQVIITKVQGLGVGMAYVKGGPLWQLRKAEADLETLRQILRALRDIYAVQQGLLLRIYPGDTDNGTGVIRALFRNEGFARNLSIGTPRTVSIDLSYSLDQLRSSFKSSWRRNLVLAERNELRIVEGRSDELFDAFAGLYKEMQRRKRIVGVVDINYFQQIQRDLPQDLKMRVVLCEHRGEPVAGLAVPLLGNRAQNLLAATGNKGLDLRASYLVHWRMLEWLKTQDCRWYDLDAVNHRNYPGISQFKIGFAGRLGREAEYLGQFEYCANVLSQLSVKVGEQVRRTCRGFEVAVNRCRSAFHKH